MSLTPEQLAIRATGVGASEVAAAIGMSAYATPFELYLRKRGELPPVTATLEMRHGHAAEPVIVGEFQRRHPEHQLVVHPDTMQRGRMLAHLDALAPGHYNVQAKTSRNRHNWGDSGSADVPMDYLIQVQAEMLLANVTVSFIPVLFAGSEYDEFVVEADRELQDMIETGVQDFWRCVEAGEPPEPTTYRDVQARWGRASRAATATADEACLAALAVLRGARERFAELEVVETEAKAVVMKHLADRDTLVDAHGNTLATWKACAPPKRFDAAAFKAAQPSLYEQFVKPGEPYRRLLLKDIK